MKRKGFTMIELMAVIVVLGLLASIIYPIVNKSINQSKTDLYESQINTIETGARSWGADHLTELPINAGEIKTVTLKDLQDGGYVDKELKNPKTKELFDKNITITITMNGNSLDYKVGV